MSQLIKIEDSTTTEWHRADEPWPDLPHPIILCNGGFDLLHVGHMRVLRQARSRAATLVVALDSDAKVTATKGAGRPIMSWVERAVALGYMNVDYIVEVDNDRDMATLVRLLQPDFRLQGADYIGQTSRFEVPKLFVRRSKQDISTSRIIERCKLVIK